MGAAPSWAGSACRLLGALLVVAAPAPLVAQGVIGEIRAVLDGQPRVWRLPNAPAPDDMHDAHQEEVGGTLRVTLHGHVEGGSGARDALIIELALTEGAGDPGSGTVTYVGESVARPWVSLPEEPVVTIARFEPETGVEGFLNGRLCLRDGLLAEPDRDTCIEIDGDFASALPDR